MKALGSVTNVELEKAKEDTRGREARRKGQLKESRKGSLAVHVC